MGVSDYCLLVKSEVEALSCLLMDNQEQGRDGQPLADHLLLRPEVDPFPPQKSQFVNLY